MNNTEEKEIKRITSFSVDHDFITPGMYISRIDGDITTYDLRTRKPNAGDYMDHITMHSLEHMFATYVRNSDIGDKVIYFGPMGCRTGFYLLIRTADTLTDNEVLCEVKKVLRLIIDHTGTMFGQSRKECGNYLELSVDSAKSECKRYLEALEAKEQDFIYPTK